MENEYDKEYLKYLENKKYFSRNELQHAMEKFGFKIGEASFKANLQKLLNSNQIFRVGRNAYCVPNETIKKYSHEYSELAENVAKIVKGKHPYLYFTILELIQFNEFVNHQLAHNIVFVSVEEDLGDFVFDTLKEKFPGKVLINPTTEIYHQYWCDNMIVIKKMISEAPFGLNEKWNTRIEKLLVDLMTDNLLQSSIAASEYTAIFEEVFSKYAIDESCLFRYAKRRGADKKIRKFILDKTNIKLRLG